MRIIPAPVKPHKYGSNRRSVMPSRVKRAVYAFAFGLGLAIGFLLVRNAPAPPVAQDRASQHPIRRTATTPETTMRVNHPPALPSMRTPRAESNNRAREIPDAFEDAILFVQAPRSATPSAPDSKASARRTAHHPVQPQSSTPTSTHATQPSTAGTATASPIPAHQASPLQTGDSRQSEPAPVTPGADPPTSSTVDPASPSTGMVGLQAPEPIRGTLSTVRPDTLRFTVQGPTGTQEFRVAQETMIYAGTERIAFSRMTEFIGAQLTVWLVSGESEQLAGRVDLTTPPAAATAPPVAGGANGGQIDAATRGASDPRAGGNSGAGGGGNSGVGSSSSGSGSGNKGGGTGGGGEKGGHGAHH